MNASMNTTVAARAMTPAEVEQQQVIERNLVRWRVERQARRVRQERRSTVKFNPMLREALRGEAVEALRGLGVGA
jgi:hypothetical protein